MAHTTHLRPRIHPRIAAAFAATLSVPAWADLPLTVEELITEQGKTRLDLSFSYANATTQSISTGSPIEVQVGPTSFVVIPTSIGDRIANSDAAVLTLGLRRGLTGRTEVFGRASWLATQERGINVGETSSSSRSGFVDLWVGVSHIFKDDDATPAVLGFGEVALVETQQVVTAHLKAASFGVTTFHAIDPIVLSLTAAYRLNKARSDGFNVIEPGNSMMVSPSLGFAVNETITLTGGLIWTNRARDRVEGIARGLRRTTTDLVLGAGFAWDKDNILNMTCRTTTSGRHGVDLRVNWLRTF